MRFCLRVRFERECWCRCIAIGLWFSACWVQAAPAGDASIAERLIAELDLGHPELVQVAELVDHGQLDAALSAWRDLAVRRLRAHDFGQFGWHGYVLHPRPGHAADAVCGLISREEYLSSDLIGFVDIYGMSGPPGTVQRIDWFTPVTDAIDWGDSGIGEESRQKQLLRTNYSNFEFLKAFAGQYWKTDNEVYRRKAFEIMGDFTRRHAREFWDAYRNEPFHDQEVHRIYRCDWRLNTNGLGAGWRLKNLMKVTACFSKCVGADKPSAWENVLAPVHGDLSREQLDLIPAEHLASIALSGYNDHAGKILWFCLRPGAVPNQRAEGLKAAAFLATIFPTFCKSPQLTAYVNRAYTEMLASNFLPDGGSLEQSFNYNKQDMEGLEELVAFFADEPPPYARQALAKAASRRAVNAALQTPLGSLPQVGNSHHALGKAVWRGDEIAQRYWGDAHVGPKWPLEPQAFLSIAFPYSGFYVMRSGWTMDDLYLFMMNGRPQRGHSMRDNLSVQLIAYGRQLLVCGGPPTYGNPSNQDAKGAEHYLSEASSLKVNTVLVDGKSQAKHGPKAAVAPQTPVNSRFHTSPWFDLADGTYDLGYETADPDNRQMDASVAHERVVTFVREAKLWIVLDRMHLADDTPHDFTQVWNLPPDVEDTSWAKSMAGFSPDHVRTDADNRRISTTDADGPNLDIFHAGPEHLRYDTYYGDRERWLGWFARGIGDAVPAVDAHATWASADSTILLTVLAPRDVAENSPVVSMTALRDETAGVNGFTCDLADGSRLELRAAAKGRALLSCEGVSTEADFLLCHRSSAGIRGIVHGGNALTVNGQSTGIEQGSAFEFALLRDQAPQLQPIGIPDERAPEDAAPTFEPLPPREPDLEDARRLEAGLHYRYAERPRWSRIYDLMLDADMRPLETGRCTSLDATPESTLEGGQAAMVFDGYLDIPRDGAYTFHVACSGGLFLFIHNPEQDLDVPPAAMCTYISKRDSDTIALKRGLHQFRLVYKLSPDDRQFSVDVNGPGLDRQSLPASWLYRRRDLAAGHRQ